jgi:hypothetical protein
MTYSISASKKEQSQKSKASVQPNKRAYNINNNNMSYTPRPRPIMRSYLNKMKSFNKSWPSNLNRDSQNNRVRFPNNIPLRNRNANNKNNNTCSLCGMSNHEATNCRNMVDNQGKKIELIPTYGVCQACPQSVHPRLHHPEALCPYRPGGPFNKRQ